jgi:hypothetical protein
LQIIKSLFSFPAGNRSDRFSVDKDRYRLFQAAFACLIISFATPLKHAFSIKAPQENACPKTLFSNQSLQQSLTLIQLNHLYTQILDLH